MNPPPTVFVAVNIASHAGRDTLTGIFEFIDSGHPMIPKFIASQADVKTIAGELRGKSPSGFIYALGTGDPETVEAINRMNCPLVVFGSRTNSYGQRQQPTGFVWNDNRAIGELGGRFLCDLGAFTSYGFVFNQNGGSYSRERLRGFTAALRRANRSLTSAFKSTEIANSRGDLDALSAWLGALRKPAAVMCAEDTRALSVLTAAKQAGISVPDQLAVLGVDNDELLASHCSPPLSSIQPGHFDMGYKAAEILYRILTARRPPRRLTTVIPPKCVVKRESTGHIKPSVILVERAEKLMHRLLIDGSTASDIVSRLGCSRELADLRFRELRGMTLRARFAEIRLAEAKRLLTTTTRSISDIAVQCGYKSASRFSRTFRQSCGMPVSEWRKTAART